MLPLTVLPSLNAILNAAAAVLLTAGYIAIRRRNIRVHRICMQSALAVSTLFLISYLTYHYNVGSKRFTGQGAIRTAYFTILVSHTILAAAIVPMVILTVTRAWKGVFDRHVKIARRTLPLWLYVSVTGVVVYWMLYQL